MFRTYTLLISLAVAALMTVTAHAQDVASTARRLGDTIEVTTLPHSGTSTRWGRAIGVVDSPFSVVSRVVRDYDNYTDFLPHFEQSRVLSRRSRRDATVYMEAKIIRGTVTIWSEMRLQSRQSGDTLIVEGAMQNGNIDRMLARFEVTPLDGGRRSLLAFQLLVEPRVPVPASVYTSQNESAVRRSIAALRERARALQGQSSN